MNIRIENRSTNRTGLVPGAWQGVRRGFTLVELLVVVTIIGLLVSVILVASMGSLAMANLKATQALVLKLDLAVKERMQALLDDEIYPNATHMWLATPAANKPPIAGTAIFGPMRGLTPGRGANARAKAIAMTDYLRAEMPDFFVVNDSSVAGFYPVNFGGIAQTMLGTVSPISPNAAIAPYILPIGTAYSFNGTSSFGSYYPPNPATPAAPVNQAYNQSYNVTGTGVFGASYAAASGIYKQLGYGPAGYDGIDNNGNGLVDEMAEGVPNAADRTALIARLQLNHNPKTARSAMLYALLVEGQGPLGAVFSRDDFTDLEIADTDGDGLLEFVDAWGEPLQFYRWPMWYTSDNQRGWADYPTDPWVTRERNSLDPSSSLVGLEWWSDIPGVGGDPIATRAGSREMRIFEHFFHPLTEATQFSVPMTAWDRTGDFTRRAYRSTPLIVSGGPDMKVGIRMWGQVQEHLDRLSFERDYGNLAVKLDFYAFANTAYRSSAYTVADTPVGASFDDDFMASSEDDISSHALQQGQGGGAR
jgi:prepilin-type N-terminal cleavage/methylation domain-containing protein